MKRRSEIALAAGFATVGAVAAHVTQEATGSDVAAWIAGLAATLACYGLWAAWYLRGRR